MIKFTLVSLILFLSNNSFAEPLKINLTDSDQIRLTKELSKIDSEYRREEIDQTVPYPLVHKYYNFLDVRYAFSIGCYEQFANNSTVGQKAQCSIIFNSELSTPDSINVHDGFMSEFIIAEIKDSSLASILYKTIGNGVSPKVFFNTQEQVTLTHPSTGQKINGFRLRIDCERNPAYTAFSCVASAVK